MLSVIQLHQIMTSSSTERDDDLELRLKQIDELCVVQGMIGQSLGTQHTLLRDEYAATTPIELWRFLSLRPEL